MAMTSVFLRIASMSGVTVVRSQPINSGDFMIAHSEKCDTCAKARERERERECVCVCVCVCEREREWVSERVSERVRESERERVSEWEKVCERERERVSERESVCVCTHALVIGESAISDFEDVRVVVSSCKAHHEGASNTEQQREMERQRTQA
jgi:hypothetical protein